MKSLLVTTAILTGISINVAAGPAERAGRIDNRLNALEARGAWEQGSRWDRLEDRFDRREDRRDRAVTQGPRDLIEDRYDRAENRWDRRENRLDRNGNVSTSD